MYCPVIVTPGGKTVTRLCYTDRYRDSLRESSMIAGGHEQLVTHNVQDEELAAL